ncbi:kinase phosphorylation protein-domain-containing protein, partial [Scenedesmus sp. NREL 46B-D3]
MSLYNGPPRPGARGGRGEFSWDNVKADKDREYYLGHSVKATTGRWAKGKDVFWYTKAAGAGGVSNDELEAVKQQERDMMAEALGLKPKAPPSSRTQPALEKHEVDKLLKGGAGADDDQPAALEGERGKGLGFGAGSAVAVREEVHEVLQGTGMPAAAATAAAGDAAAAGRQAGMMTAEQLAALDKADRRAAKKAEKKAKTTAKKAKKDSKSKRKHKHRSRSRSTSSSSDREDQRQHKRSHQQQQLPPPPPLQPRSEHPVRGEQQQLRRQPLGVLNVQAARPGSEDGLKCAQADADIFDALFSKWGRDEETNMVGSFDDLLWEEGAPAVAAAAASMGWQRTATPGGLSQQLTRPSASEQLLPQQQQQQQGQENDWGHASAQQEQQN